MGDILFGEAENVVFGGGGEEEYHVEDNRIWLRLFREGQGARSVET